MTHLNGGEREYQELWFNLSRTEWRSLALVPAEPGVSTERVARSLAEVGNLLSETPVVAVGGAALEDGDVDGSGPGEGAPAPRADALRVEVLPRVEVLARSVGRRLVLAVPPVDEPLGLAAAHRADAVVIAIEPGRTLLANVRRTVELVGRGRILGCIVIR